MMAVDVGDDQAGDPGLCRDREGRSVVTRVMIIDCDGPGRGGQSDGHHNGWPPATRWPQTSAQPPMTVTVINMHTILSVIKIRYPTVDTIKSCVVISLDTSDLETCLSSSRNMTQSCGPPGQLSEFGGIKATH